MTGFLLRKRLEELSVRSSLKGIYAYSPFLSPSEQSEASCVYPAINFIGGCDFAERKIAVFGDEKSLGFTESPPISLLFVKLTGQKFATELSHRDYLGAILNLGVERERIGDIFVCKEGAYLVADENVAELIKRELKKVGRNYVEAEDADGIPEDFRPKTEEKKISVSSCRVDAVISRVYDLSRGAGSALCEKGFVFINGKQTDNGSKTLKVGDVVSARGYGKFEFLGEDGFSRKGKTFALVKVFK